ncbi:MAG: dephospho-CoA kinase [Candidatus Cloacimonetes bacterium]|nr:dephospho-CoA kinase [Candidatus Cloacimonadota bacterium]
MNDNKRELFVIGISGSVGSGKSLAVEWFKKQGFITVSSDIVGHDLLLKEKVKERVVEVFGKEILLDGQIDRKKLGDIVFDDPEKLKILNSILHPLIIAQIQDLINSSSTEVIVFEVPLLFETGIEGMFDLIINISASHEVRLQRLVERDKLSAAEIEQRFRSQFSDETKRELADITVENNCRKECLFNQLEVLGQFLFGRDE